MHKSKKQGYRGASGLRNAWKGALVAVIMLLLTVGCSSGPSQSPEDMVKSFLAKHLSMTDISLAKYYTADEQPGIIEQVTTSINSKKDQGTLDKLSNAQYDLSGVNINVIDKKTDYVNDEEVTFLKVAVKGSYSVTNGDTTQELTEDEVLILQSAGNEWKVTEKTNPWK